MGFVWSMGADRWMCRLNDFISDHSSILKTSPPGSQRLMSPKATLVGSLSNVAKLEKSSTTMPSCSHLSRVTVTSYS